MNVQSTAAKTIDNSKTTDTFETAADFETSAKLETAAPFKTSTKALAAANSNSPAARRASRLAPWLSDSLVLGLAAVAVLSLLGSLAWTTIVAASSALTILTFEMLPSLGTPRGYVAEAFCLSIAAALGAIPPAVSMAFSEWRARDRFASTAALYPLWLVVMLAPAGVVYQFSGALDPSLHRAHLAADFVMLFSASATAVALAYATWVRHHPDAVRRNDILPKPERKIAAPRGVGSMMMAEAA